MEICTYNLLNSKCSYPDKINSYLDKINNQSNQIKDGNIITVTVSFMIIMFISSDLTIHYTVHLILLVYFTPATKQD